jgi:hypothetical protein
MTSPFFITYAEAKANFAGLESLTKPQSKLPVGNLAKVFRQKHWCRHSDC